MSEELELAYAALLDACVTHRHEIPLVVWEYVCRAIEVQRKDQP